jgi:carboxyl-terminal processing protease
LAGNIGYVSFNVFIGDAVAKFQAALREFHDTKGLIIDLRGNPGGVGSMAPTMADSLNTGAGSLGVSRFRYATQQFAFKGSGRDAYMGKVVILVDENSASTSEVFTGGLQENGRVTVVGTNTAGAVLPSLQAILPTRGVMQHVISDFKTPKGIVLEGRGVIPNIVAGPTRAALLSGHDVALERAVEFVGTGR